MVIFVAARAALVASAKRSPTAPENAVLYLMIYYPPRACSYVDLFEYSSGLAPRNASPPPNEASVIVCHKDRRVNQIAGPFRPPPLMRYFAHDRPPRSVFPTRGSLGADRSSRCLCGRRRRLRRVRLAREKPVSRRSRCAGR